MEGGGHTLIYLSRAGECILIIISGKGKTVFYEKESSALRGKNQCHKKKERSAI